MGLPTEFGELDAFGSFAECPGEWGVDDTAPVAVHVKDKSWKIWFAASGVGWRGEKSWMSSPTRVIGVAVGGLALAALGAPILMPGLRAGEMTFATAEVAPPQPTEHVKKTDEEWRELLSPEQFRVTRRAGTERPFGALYEQFKRQGVGAYHCVCCGAKLFTSETKFDAGCGWPAFYDPATATGILEKPDHSGGMVRTEVVCAKCDAHLGHVFDGEGFATPTDRRYCINAVAMRFVPAGEDAGDGGEGDGEDASGTDGESGDIRED